MKKAVAINTGYSDGEWVSLAELVNQCGGLEASENMQRWVTDALRNRRLPYRYCVGNSDVFCSGGLPDHFFHGAKIHWRWSVVTFGDTMLHHVGVRLRLAVIDAAGNGAKTKSPGRPNLINSLIAEAQRRIETGEITPRRGGLTAFAEDLAQWWEHERHRSNERSLSARGIANAIRDLWNEALSAENTK
jgi:hypothetical protein